MNGRRRQVVYLSLGAPHLEFPGVADALKDRGVDAELVHLDDLAAVDWGRVDLVNVRMARGYHKRPDFLRRVEDLHTRLQEASGGPVPMANDIGLVRDAVDKGRYLRFLADDGIDVIPTRWITRGTRFRVTDLMEDTGWHDVVVKPTVSSGSWRTIRVSRAGTSTSSTHFLLGARDLPYERLIDDLVATRDVCVQRFLPQVLSYGELSFVFLGGRFSHAVRKTVGDEGGWWAHERIGGRNIPHVPDDADLVWAMSVNRILEERYGTLWFGRVDGIRDENGVLRLLECELAIPRLLLPEGKAFDRYADGIVQGMDGAMAAPR